MASFRATEPGDEERCHSDRWLMEAVLCSATEVHRLVTTSEKNLRQLRDYVSAATVVLNVKRRSGMAEEHDIETGKLFMNALNIFDPSVKNIDPDINITVHPSIFLQTLAVHNLWCLSRWIGSYLQCKCTVPSPGNVWAIRHSA